MGVLSAVTVGSILGLVALVALFLALLTAACICALKAKWGLFVVGWLFGPFWIVGAWRLGKPDSSWARNHYGEDKLAAAARRFPKGGLRSASPA